MLASPANGAIFTAPADVTIAALASDVDGSVLRVEFFNSGVKLGESTSAPFSFIWSNAPAGTHTLSAKARDNGLALTESLPIGITIRQPVFTNLTFVPAGAVWRYHDKGQNLGTNWTALAYNDSGWSNGAAQLGYGDNDEATVVSYGPSAGNKYVTTYFRRTFVNTAPVPFTALLLRLVRDDGIVVWLNGREIFRDNMPGSAVVFNTLASSSLGAPLENAVIQTNLSPALIAPGTNILAVEIHQGAVDSGDISFDLEFVVTLIRPEPQLTFNVSAARSTFRWPALAGAFRLEHTTNLTPPVAWTPLTNGAMGDVYWNDLVLTNASETRHQFFRLNRF